MLIYNITFIIEHSQAQAFHNWLTSEGLTAFRQDTDFSEATLMRIVDPANEEGESLALQFRTEYTVEMLRDKETSILPSVLSKWCAEWHRHLVYFATVMQPIAL